MLKRVVLLVFVLAFFVSTSVLAADVIKLTYANYYAPTHVMSHFGETFCKDIKERTKGRVEITYNTGGSLLAAPKVYNGVVTGLADIGLSNLSYTRGRFPVMEIMELPLGFSSGYVGAMVATDFYQKFKPKEWDQVQMLYWNTSAPNLIASRSKQIRTLEDLKNERVRAIGSTADIIKALGGTPMPLEIPDVYEALRRGVIDDIFGPMEMMKGWKFHELLKSVTASWQIGSVYAFYIIMNKDKYNSLPADIKTIFDQTAKEYMEKSAISRDKEDIEGKELITGNGGQIILLSEAEAKRWQKATEPLIANFKKDLIGKGYKEKEVDEWIAFVRERIQYWKGQQKAKGIPSAF